MMLVALMAENTNPTGQESNGGFNQKSFPTTLLLLPTLNEADAIPSLIREAQACGFSNILVVDGGSTDGTREAAETAGVKVTLQEFGKGKGCGVRTGMKLFLESGEDILCMLDADTTNNPTYLPKMIHYAHETGADIVLGSRIRGNRDPGSMPTLSFASNLTVSFLFGVKYRRLFTDIQTGYWAFTKTAVQKIYPLLHSTGFEIEMEIFTTAQKAKLNLQEIPVGYRVRKGSTKFNFKLRIRNLYYAIKCLTA